MYLLIASKKPNILYQQVLKSYGGITHLKLTVNYLNKKDIMINKLCICQIRENFAVKG